MRKQHSATFKAQLLELLKEEKTVSELASVYGVHPTMLHRWKKQVLADLPQVFERERDATAAKEAYEKRIEELYTEIGRLSTQLAWLKKKVSTLTRQERLALLDWDDQASGAVEPEPLRTLLPSPCCIA